MICLNKVQKVPTFSANLCKLLIIILFFFYLLFSETYYSSEPSYDFSNVLHKSLEINDLTVSYYEAGDKKDQPLVFIHALKLSNLVLVGQLFGGSIVVINAQNHPNLVSQLVLVDANAHE